MIKVNKLYIITWDDAWVGNRTYDSDNDYSPLRTQDVGWVVEENDETIVIATSFTPDLESYRHVTVIPWDMVVSMEELV